VSTDRLSPAKLEICSNCVSSQVSSDLLGHLLWASLRHRLSRVFPNVCIRENRDVNIRGLLNWLLYLLLLLDAEYSS
jgi:hypothetical protein